MALSLGIPALPRMVGRRQAVARRLPLLAVVVLAAAMAALGCCGAFAGVSARETPFVGNSLNRAGSGGLGTLKAPGNAAHPAAGSALPRRAKDGAEVSAEVREFLNSPLMRAAANPALLLVIIFFLGIAQDYGGFPRKDAYQVDPCAREVPWIQQKYFGQRDCRSSDTAGSPECRLCALKKNQLSS